MELNLAAEGLKFMVLGMVTVFLFLILMVIILNIQAKVINKYFPPKSPSTSQGSGNPQVQHHKPSKGDSKALVAAITAAVQTFKNSKSN